MEPWRAVNGSLVTIGCLFFIPANGFIEFHSEELAARNTHGRLRWPRIPRRDAEALQGNLMLVDSSLLIVHLPKLP
jgi:hypothetical protein